VAGAHERPELNEAVAVVGAGGRVSAQAVNGDAALILGSLPIEHILAIRSLERISEAEPLATVKITENDD